MTTLTQSEPVRYGAPALQQQLALGVSGQQEIAANGCRVHDLARFQREQRRLEKVVHAA